MPGSVPKKERFRLGLSGFLGLLKYPSVTLKSSENHCFQTLYNDNSILPFLYAFSAYKVENMPIDSIKVVVLSPQLAL
jgi:hypothetical protein